MQRKQSGAGGNVTESFQNLEAKLTVSVTPQISYEGFVTLEIVVQDNQFAKPGEQTGDRTEKEVRTSVIIANNGVLALGGLVKNTFSETESKVPILGDIPGIGWLFKNKTKSKTKTSLLILVSPEVIPPNNNSIANKFTAAKLTDAEETIFATDKKYKKLDPIHRWFFNDNADDGKAMMDKYIDKEGDYLHPNQKKKREAVERKRKRLSDFL